MKNSTILLGLISLMIIAQSCYKTSQPEVNRSPDTRRDFANVFWTRDYTLFDLLTDEPIFPEMKNGQKVYTIYYSSNEDPKPYKGSFTESALENHLFYKFKTEKSCLEFCVSKKGSGF